MGSKVGSPLTARCSPLASGGGAVAGEVEDVEVPRVALGAGEVFGAEGFAEEEGDHFLVAPAVGTEAFLDDGEVVVIGGAPEDDVAAGADDYL